MTYTKNAWNVGDKITKTKLDILEQGVADADLTNPASASAQAASTTQATLATQLTGTAAGLAIVFGS